MVSQAIYSYRINIFLDAGKLTSDSTAFTGEEKLINKQTDCHIVDRMLRIEPRWLTTGQILKCNPGISRDLASIKAYFMT
ncbi:hypothetical protein GCM10028816_30680 [Spirosoma lituiforme]